MAKKAKLEHFEDQLCSDILDTFARCEKDAAHPEPAKSHDAPSSLNGMVPTNETVLCPPSKGPHASFQNICQMKLDQWESETRWLGTFDTMGDVVQECSKFELMFQQALLDNELLVGSPGATAAKAAVTSGVSGVSGDTSGVAPAAALHADGKAKTLTGEASDTQHNEHKKHQRVLGQVVKCRLRAPIIKWNGT